MKVAAPALPCAPQALERRVVLLGFAPFERHQLATVLRLADARALRYRLVDAAASAELAVVDTDDAEGLATVRRTALPALGVGRTAAEGLLHLPRPINVARVVRTLDQLARRGPPPSAHVQRVLDDLAQVAGLPPTRPRARLLIAAHDAAATPLQLAPLRRAGCELLRVRSGVEATECASREPLDLVVIDTGQDGLDGYHACRSIQQRARAAGRPAPPVVLIATGPWVVNQLRAEMVGAAALLPAPLDAGAILALLPASARTASPAAAADAAPTSIPPPVPPKAGLHSDAE